MVKRGSVFPFLWNGTLFRITSLVQLLSKATKQSIFTCYFLCFLKNWSTVNLQCCLISAVQQSDSVVQMCVRAPLLQSCLILWACSPQAPLSMGFYRQEFWSGLLSLPLPKPGLEPTSVSPPLQADSLPTEPPGNLYMRIYYAFFLKFLFHYGLS